MLDYHAAVKAIFRKKTPAMGALEHPSADVLRLLLRTPGVDINLQNEAQESASWYAIEYGTCRTVQNWQMPVQASRWI
ncbi:hypothetical protein N7451_012225 [Penicillium sp. IBT 35674x]|nr:hypothetical protein N7451_012225 [Penicillium sp. IBT 35674x]